MKKIILKFKKGESTSVDRLNYPQAEIDNSFINFNRIKNKLDDMGDSLICLRNIKITIDYDDKIDLDEEIEKINTSMVDSQKKTKEKDK